MKYETRLVFRWSLWNLNCDGNQRWGILGKDLHIPKWVFKKQSSVAILRNRPILQTDDTCIFNKFSHLSSHRAKIRTINWFSQIASRTMGRNFDFLSKNFFRSKMDFSSLISIGINQFWHILGTITKLRNAFREGGQLFVTNHCKHIGICTVLNHEGGGGSKIWKKMHTYYVNAPLGPSTSISVDISVGNILLLHKTKTIQIISLLSKGTLPNQIFGGKKTLVTRSFAERRRKPSRDWRGQKVHFDNFHLLGTDLFTWSQNSHSVFF